MYKMGYRMYVTLICVTFLFTTLFYILNPWPALFASLFICVGVVYVSMNTNKEEKENN